MVELTIIAAALLLPVWVPGAYLLWQLPACRRRPLRFAAAVITVWAGLAAAIALLLQEVASHG